MNVKHSAFGAFAILFAAAAFTFADAPSTQPVKPYPLSKCIVSGEALDGDMGKPVVLEYQGQEMKFCCSSCVAKFKKDPDKYLKELAAAGNPTTKPS